MSDTLNASDPAISFLDGLIGDAAEWRADWSDGQFIDCAQYAFVLAGASLSDAAAAIKGAKARTEPTGPLHTAAAVLIASGDVLDVQAAMLEAEIAQHRKSLNTKLDELDTAITRAEEWRDHVESWKQHQSDWQRIRDKARSIIAEATPGVPLNEEESRLPDTAAKAGHEVELSEHRAEVCRDRAEVALAGVDVAIAAVELSSADLCETVGVYGRIVGTRARIRLLFASVEHAAALAASLNPS